MRARLIPAALAIRHELGLIVCRCLNVSGSLAAAGTGRDEGGESPPVAHVSLRILQLRVRVAAGPLAYTRPVTTAIDPSREQDVASALLAYLRRRLGAPALTYAEPPRPLGRGTSSFIYAFRLAGTPDEGEWARSLVLRLVWGDGAGAVLEREAAIQRYVGEHGGATLDLLALEPSRESELGLPFTVAERIMGGTLLDAAKRAPLSIPRLVAAMADAHVALHRIPVECSPLPYDAPLVDRRIEDWRRRLGVDGPDELLRGLGWLEEHAGRVRHEEPAICHHDFHPLNVLVGDGNRLVVIDWSDAVIGDRNSDVARTAMLLLFARLGASSAAERLALRVVGTVFRARYLARYRRQLPIDDGRMRYWEAAHAFNGWLQLVELRARGAAAPQLQLEMVQQFTPGLVDEVRRHFWRSTQRS